ncbi:MAG: transcriptional regulator [Armatimonadetes bacterium CG2_30_59_28]|nr:YebC/PmpR family DNA-binding transcriptional regulator [Armatimonadota bacterium]OIO92008.1 MAG: transcriptional regulator [Armatimonadetes bacterium CG2_30_59_28]PIU62559.1 MAG: YebC/PmpR family DNA-binding transcriptional regulator [Armatimonadetes bacterium CG07_land_8_20_14_0_80_59_28]PIX39605.1 MAG: YebC/PmpR family DNA-binding transcriptional regulator [Armatimonadetes bacterium CG_4_8_14_3_um_filter_58_9]PIY40763.1 MAG: YebC/PmpR family DNA-binding transcriptional regulator [Armatimon
MSGHSKWHNIRLRKAAIDSRKAKVFGKIAREIIVAARSGGDADSNPRLRLALQKARDARMPNDNIERAVKRGSGATDDVQYEEAVYEGYGPGGAAIYLEVLTDNRNRTVAELRRLLSKHGGAMGEAGCVAWVFDRKGIIHVPNSDGTNEDLLMETAIEGGAEDIRVQDENYEIVTSVEAFEEVKSRLQKHEIQWVSAEISMIPNNQVPLSDDDARKILQLMEVLEDHDDIQQVSSNFDIPDEFFQEQENDGD